MSQPNQVLPEFMPLHEMQAEDTTTALVYGGSGTGKTFYAGSAGPRTLFVNIGNGIKTLLSPAFRNVWPAARDMIVVNVNERVGPSGLPDVATGFDLTSDVIDHALRTMADKFDTVVVDDATALRRFAMNKGLEINQQLGKSKSLEAGRKAEIVVKAVQDYGVEMDLIEQFVVAYTTLLKEAGKNFILTAHERLLYRKGEKLGDPSVLYKVKPGFTGQTFPDTVPAYFDWVLHAEVVAGGRDGLVFRMRTMPDDVYSAKCRDGGVFGAVETKPSFSGMLEKVNKLKKGV